MFKLFEVYNDKNERVFYTEQVECLPSKHNINIMLKQRWKIKIDNKVATKKMINELY